MAKQTMWSNITENATARRQVSINVPEMNDEEANLIYAETAYEAGVAAFVAFDIKESIREFGEMADEKGFTAAEYIAEAFSFGGFFKKIFDFLVKMWTTIVNYVKALIGNKFGASGNIQKNIAKAIQGLILVAAKEFKEDAEIKVKDYKIREAAIFGKELVDPSLYLSTPLLPADKITSNIWGSGAKGAFNIINITKVAKDIASTVTDVKTDSALGVKNAFTTGTAEGIKSASDSIKKAGEDVKAFTDKIGLGEKGAVESFLLLIEESKNTGLKKVVEDAKLKETKSLTEFIRKVLGHFFAGDAAVRTLKGGTQLKSQAMVLGTILLVFGEVTGKSALNTTVASGAASGAEVADAMDSIGKGKFDDLGKLAEKLSSTNLLNSLVDPIKENLKLCEDVLAELRTAAETIKSFSASDIKVGTTDKDGEFKEDKDQKPTTEHAGEMTALGDKLIVLESAMQQVITKGMDAGAVILETASKEILSQVELLIKATGEKRKTATVDNM